LHLRRQFKLRRKQLQRRFKQQLKRRDDLQQFFQR
jgi:hypothetical protein